MALLSGSSALDYSDAVKQYLDWYLLHLNSTESDKVNGNGSIFNYRISHTDELVDLETSTGEYDSVDSYAASFITLLRGYYERTGDAEYLITNSKDIQRVISAMLSTVDTDGLAMINNDGRDRTNVSDCVWNY